MERSHTLSTSPNKKSRLGPHSSDSTIRGKTHNYFVTFSPGFEFLAEEEIVEKIRPTALKRVDRTGKIFFSTDQPLNKLLRLRSVDHLYAFVCEHNGVPSDASGLSYLEHAPQSFDWAASLELWRSSKAIEKEEQPNATPLPSNTNPNPQSSDAPLEPLFRVTGKREGNHMYKSFEVAGSVGAALITKFGFKVSLKSFNMEVLADLTGDTLVVGISLTSQPMYVKRHSAVPKSNLKSSIAYCMGKLARIHPGTKIFDPMMGMGTIPIELAEVWGNAHYASADILSETHNEAAKHIRDIGAPIELIRWNGYKLPLSNESVDLIVSDVSVRRSGTTKNHQQLYPKLIREATRILKTGGKCILLSNEKLFLNKMLSDNLYWKVMALYPVDVGGMDGGLYMLQRSQYKVGHLPVNLASSDQASSHETPKQTPK